MKKTFISGWEMCLRMQNFLNSNATLVALITGASSAKSEIDTKITAISDLKKDGVTAKNGAAAAKRKAKMELVETSRDHLAILKAHATIQKDETLLGAIKKSLRVVTRSGGSTLLTETESIIDTVQDNLAALLPWEIDAASQLVFKAKITAFSLFLTAPRQSTTKGQRIGSEVEKAIRLLIEDYKGLDAIIIAQQKKHPAFVKEYILNRQLIDLPTRKRAAMLKVLDQDTHEPLEKVKLKTPHGVYNSTKNGNLIVPSFSEGSWPVTYLVPGKTEVPGTLLIVAGITNKTIIYLNAA